MPVSRPPPPPSRRVSRNCLSGVGYGVPYDGLTHGDLDGGEVADAEGSSRVVSFDAEHDALGPAWRQIVLGFGLPQVSDGSKRDLLPAAIPRRRATVLPRRVQAPAPRRRCIEVYAEGSSRA